MRDFDWQIISTLYKTKNITHTADLLFITQPTLTRRLQQMESELNATLFIRTNKGVIFTSEGEYAAQKADEILSLTNNVKEYMNAAGNGSGGTIRIGVPNSFMYFIIPSLVHKFSEKFPDINLELHTDLSSRLIRDLEQRELHLCFARGNIVTPLKKHLLSEDQIHIISKQQITLEDLPALPQIEYVKEETIVKATMEWWNERFASKPKIRFKVNSGEACLQMVKHGLGYGIFSDAKYFNPADNLNALPLTYKNGSKFTRKSWLVYDKKDLKSNILLSRFVSFTLNTDINSL